MAPSWVKELQPAGPQGSELLEKERSQSNLPVSRLAEFLFTKDVLARQDKILKVLKSEKAFDKSQNYFDGREARFITALSRAKRLQQLAEEYRWTRDEYVMATELISEPGPYGLHVSMFLVCHAHPWMDGAGLMTSDNPPRSRNTGAAQIVPREGREISDHRLLCTDRIGSWVQRARLRDHGYMECGRQDFHPALTESYSIKVVDW